MYGRFIELTENLPYMVQHRAPIPIIDKVLSPPKVQEGVQFDTKMYIIIALIGLLVVFRLSSR
jgi:hypothetical protein